MKYLSPSKKVSLKCVETEKGWIGYLTYHRIPSRRNPKSTWDKKKKVFSIVGTEEQVKKHIGLCFPQLKQTEEVNGK